MTFWKRKKIGLALGSGGSRGIAHVGVIKTLLENNIPIDYIAGASAGALFGGIYAAFNDVAKIENLVNELNYKQLLNVLFDPFTRNGFIKGDKVVNYLRTNIGEINIEDLKIPFQAVATDSVSGNPYVFSRGDLATAIRASSSIPLIFSPVQIDNHLLVDGGLSMPVPVELVRNMGADIVIAVDLYSSLFPKNNIQQKSKPTLQQIVGASVHLMLYHLAQEDDKQADFVISPPVGVVNPMNFVEAKHLIEIGAKATLSYIPQIKKLTRSLLPF
jgi:NTE family protein